MAVPSAIKSLLSFQDVAALLGCDAEAVRTLVVEERRLPAVRVTHVGFQEPYEHYDLYVVESDGRTLDLASGLRHTGWLRVRRTALEHFAAGVGVTIRAATGTPKVVAKESTLLNIVAALLELTLNPRPGRVSQAAVIEELVENYQDKPGISKTTLERVFAEAKQSLRS